MLGRSTKAPRIDLDSVRIASPCNMSWDAMKGDDRTRHCFQCKLDVYNVAGLTRKEAEALLLKSARGERVCMRLLRRADGTLLTKDCPVGVQKVRAIRRKMQAAAILLATGLLNVFGMKFARAQSNTESFGGISVREFKGKVQANPPPEEDMMMGDVAFPPEPAPKTEPSPRDPDDERPYRFEADEE